MKRLLFALSFIAMMLQWSDSHAQKILALYNESAEPAQVEFAQQAIKYFQSLSADNSLVFETSSEFDNSSLYDLQKYDIIIMLNEIPCSGKTRRHFEQYMEKGGAWIGFHAAGSSASLSKWEWFDDFLGVERSSSINESTKCTHPALPVKLRVEDPLHAVCRTLPDSYIAPAAEYFQWSESPRNNPDVDVLVSISPEEYPLGIGSIIPGGDTPVVWTNTKYRMIYFNFGYGLLTFSDPTQNKLITNALIWLSKNAAHRRQLINNPDPIALAYVFYRSDQHPLPDPAAITHINFAFGHVNESCNEIFIPQESGLHAITGLKEIKPSLKVLLSIGGWGSGRFSEMVSDEALRHAFAQDCKRVIDEFNLDGIDFDWEYPTNSVALISSAPEDTRNFTALMKEVRTAIGKDKLLTLATSASGKYIDFPAIEPFVDFVNIMTYDFVMTEPFHHAGLYPSSLTGSMSCYESVLAHVKAGFPIEKLVLGIPFYPRTVAGFPRTRGGWKAMESNPDYRVCWDDVAKAPYLRDSLGNFAASYDNPRSIAYKCRFIHKYGMKGAMYWSYSSDDEQGTLRWAVYNGIMLKDE
ncbi:MAG: glycosyl hydrolase family 18 protein [Bacteroidales bacterium]|nr:glycosyl hydrolase family 18 protein [Bacteroidales bacterium]